MKLQQNISKLFYPISYKRIMFRIYPLNERATAKTKKRGKYGMFYIHFTTNNLSLQVSVSTQTLQNELVFYNPQEPLDEEISALLVAQ